MHSSLQIGRDCNQLRRRRRRRMEGGMVMTKTTATARITKSKGRRGIKA